VIPVALVHGAGHGAWCWAPMMERMTSPALAVDLPPRAVRGGPDRWLDLPELHTLTVADFAESVLADADAAGYDRFVLVGHSLAGLTIPEVARRAPDRVVHLVFVTCAIPAEGGASLDRLHEDIARMARANIRRVLDAAGTCEHAAPSLSEDMIRHMFGTDLDETAMQLVLDNFGNDVMPVLDEKISRVGVPPSIPKTWVRCLRDTIATVDDQDRAIELLEEVPGGHVDVVDMDTGHNAMLSRPAELAAIIDGIAAGYTPE